MSGKILRLRPAKIVRNATSRRLVHIALDDVANDNSSAFQLNPTSLAHKHLPFSALGPERACFHTGGPTEGATW
jgi:hypothetical protein